MARLAGGRLVNIDFHKRELPIGPQVAMKIAAAVLPQAGQAGTYFYVAHPHARGDSSSEYDGNRLCRSCGQKQFAP